MSTQQDEQLLLDAIARTPSDPEPRLVYADALSARGDPHGELIVVQHTLSTFQGSWSKTFSVDAEQLRARERVLVGVVTNQLGLPSSLAPIFENGFVTTLRIVERRMSSEPPRSRFDHPALSIASCIRFDSPTAAQDVLTYLQDAPFASRIRRLEGDHLSRARLEASSFAPSDVIAELSIPLGSSGALLSRHAFPSLTHLELVEDPFVDPVPTKAGRYPTPEEREARSIAEQEHQTKQRSALEKVLASSSLKVRHLVLRTSASVSAKTVFSKLEVSPILPSLESLSISVLTRDGLAPPFAIDAAAFAHVRFIPRTMVAEDLSSLGHVLLAMNRPLEALPLLEDAYCMAPHLTQTRESFVKASRSLKTPGERSIEDADPAHPDRDDGLHRVPALLGWSRATRAGTDETDKEALADKLLDRVLAAAPNHAHAWALRAQAITAAFGDRSDAAAAYARALENDPDHVVPLVAESPSADLHCVANAYALFADDPESAIDALRAFGWGGEASSAERLHAHAAVLTALAHVALDAPRSAFAPLDALDARATCPRTWAFSTLARGFAERALGKSAAGRAHWMTLSTAPADPKELVTAIARQHPETGTHDHGEEEPYDAIVCGFAALFAAAIASAEPYPRRKALHAWLERRQQASLSVAAATASNVLRPISALIFMPMFATCERLMPATDMSMIRTELDLLTGSTER